jgi:hypothetical protein
MYSIGMRGICVIIWVISAFQGAGAWEVGDWRRFIEQIAQALVAAVIWFAVPRGAEEFRPLPIGTRSLRLAIYGGVLAVAMIASLPWPWSDSAYGSSAVFMFAAVIFLLVLRAEHESTP